MNEPAFGDNIYYYDIDFQPYHYFWLNNKSYRIDGAVGTQYYSSYDEIVFDALNLPIVYPVNCENPIAGDIILADQPKIDASGQISSGSTAGGGFLGLYELLFTIFIFISIIQRQRRMNIELIKNT